MTPVATSRLTLGMPHLAPEQLSEVELLKYAGDFQWQQIGSLLRCAPHKLVNDAGERLYSSFINVESSFFPGSISQFQEGDVLHFSGTVRFYAKQFVEGWVLLGRNEQPGDDQVGAARTKSDLAGCGRPWIYMTNALIARMGENVRLKVFRPAGIQHIDVPEAPEKPVGLSEHERVQETGDIEPWGEEETLLPIRPIDNTPVTYRIMPENDLNGAALLYFARYVAMMNYAERIFLLRRLERPFSSHLTQFLSTESRRTYFFANAAPTDRVMVRCSAALVDQQEPPPITDPTRTNLMRFVFDFELYRHSDGVLMAKSRARKCLTIPNRIKSLRAEALRFQSEQR
jgi:probable biosynthetic protein (TIGR04098 family)